MKKILIIGSNGFIGSHLTDYLKNENFEVFGCDISENRTNIKNQYFQVDSVSPDYFSILKENSFSVVINCSGAASVPKSFETPDIDFTLNTRNVLKQLEAVRNTNYNCTYINISSAAVYGNPTELPIKENTQTSPVSPYGFHKLCAELICNEYRNLFNINAVSLRVFSAYGQGLKKQIFFDISQKALNDSEIHVFGTGKETRDYIHIKDICNAVTLLILSDKKLPSVINIANGIQISVKEVVDEILQALNCRKKIIFSKQNRTGDPYAWQADITTLKEFGYKQSISLKDGVKEYVEWLKKN
jgi:dTDP-glucose 4,6-dehydratase/UDP-glucose 4-epimerase